MSAYNNTITLVGYLGKDPEVRMTKNEKTVTSFSLAVERNNGKNKITDWFTVTAWNNVARGVAKNLSKGNRVIVFGELTANIVENQDGEKRTYYNVNARNVGYDLNIPEDSVI